MVIRSKTAEKMKKKTRTPNLKNRTNIHSGPRILCTNENAMLYVIHLPIV